MTYWFRFLRANRLKPNEVQAKIPMIVEPRSKRAFELIPVRDPEIYPLLVCVGTGFTMFTLYNIYNFVWNPEICVSKARRETPAYERYDPEQVRAYVQHRAQLATLRPNAANTDPSFDLFDAQHHAESTDAHVESRDDNSVSQKDDHEEDERR